VNDVEASDRDLVKRMLSGQEEAFAEFFDGHFPRLYRFALVRVNYDADAAEDVAQTVMCRAVAKLQTYRGEAMLFTWLCTFCRHEIAEWHSRRGRTQPVDLPEDSPETQAVLESLAAGMGGGPEDELQRKEVARWVQMTLDSLPYPVREIAARLQLSPKAAESLLTRARRAFREAFSALLGESMRPGSSRA